MDVYIILLLEVFAIFPNKVYGKEKSLLYPYGDRHANFIAAKSICERHTSNILDHWEITVELAEDLWVESQSWKYKNIWINPCTYSTKKSTCNYVTLQSNNTWSDCRTASCKKKFAVVCKRKGQAQSEIKQDSDVKFMYLAIAVATFSSLVAVVSCVLRYSSARKLRQMNDDKRLPDVNSCNESESSTCSRSPEYTYMSNEIGMPSGHNKERINTTPYCNDTDEGHYEIMSSVV